MRAQVLKSFDTPYEFSDIPNPPDPTGHQLLIQVLAASYCHTDAVFASGAMWQDLPRVGSHEFAGKVLKLGPDVSESLKIAEGTVVGVPGRAFEPCGQCYECINNDGDPKGYGVWCNKAGNLGLTRDGGFQEYCLVDSRQVAPVPQGLEAVDVAPLMCAGVTIWNALEAGGIDTNTSQSSTGSGSSNSTKSVAILGAGGGLGHLGVQFAARLGCQVVAVDVGPKPIKLLEEVVSALPADLQKRVHIVDASQQDASVAKLSIFGPPSDPSLDAELGCDAALILPEAQQSLDYGIALLRSHSTVVCVSFPKDGFRFNPRDLVFRHIKMTGVLVGRNRQLRSMLKFAAENGVRATKKIYRLEDLNGLVEDYHKGAGGKLVVDMALA